MKYQNLTIKNSIIKVIGLFEEYPGIDNKLENNGYEKEITGEKENKFLKDYFYPDFKKLMFGNHMLIQNRRFNKNHNQRLLIESEKFQQPILVTDSELYLFGEEYIALFSITIKIEMENLTFDLISDLLNYIRQFDAKIDNKEKWYQWIEREILCETKIRGQGIFVDDFSGSKFKLYTIIDTEYFIDPKTRLNLLYDIGTTSPLGSSFDPKSSWHPHPEYLSFLMTNKISLYNNWEGIALFDSFTIIGHGILDNPIGWNHTYFRIYIFRLFFKYNLFRFNSLVSLDKKIVSLRETYEHFLNIFNIYPISYNFLPNEIFKKIGNGLEIKSELEDFHARISRISDAIKERKQEKMNLLLEFISVIGAVAAVEAINMITKLSKELSGISEIIFYTFLAIILLIAISIIYRFISPQKKIKSIWKTLFGKKLK